MTDTTYALEEIEAALHRCWEREHTGLPFGETEINMLRQELTRKPDFREGQVVAYGQKNDQLYDVFPLVSLQNPQARPLNQTGVGPDWVPAENAPELDKCLEVNGELAEKLRDMREAAMALREIAQRLLNGVATEGEGKLLRSVIEAFDKALEANNE